MLESLNDALVECVKCCGGSKVVGPKLWPEKTIDAAQRLLLDCLNPDRPAHVTPDQMILLMRLGREKGCHDVMNYVAENLGYSKPTPIDAKDELVELVRQGNESKRQILELQRADSARNERVERLLQQAALRSVA